MKTLKEMLEQNYERLLELLSSDLTDEAKDEIKGIYKEVGHDLVNVNACAVAFEDAVIECIRTDEFNDIVKKLLHSGTTMQKFFEMYPDYPDEEDDDLD